MSEIDRLFKVGQEVKDEKIERYKAEFYIGKISRVYKDKCYVQTDNFSLLRSRINRSDFLIPNTINYLVVIESITGIYLAEVISSQLNEGNLTRDALVNNNDSLHPILQIKIIGIYKEDKFELSGFSNVGIGDKVYVATTSIEKLYQSSLEIIKQNNEHKKQLTFANMIFFGEKNIQFKISPNGLLSNHFMILGATNSGKSTSALSILEQLYNKDIKFILIDPTGEYSESFEKSSKVDPLILGENAKLDTHAITDEQWLMLFNPNTETQEQQLLGAINELKVARELSNQGEYNEEIITDGVIKKEGISVKNIEEILKSNVSDDIDIDANKIISQLNFDAVIESGSKNNPTYKFDQFKKNNLKWLIDQISYRLNKLKLIDFFCDPDKKKNDSMNYNLLEKISDLKKNMKNSLYINTSKIGITNDSGKMIIDLICNKLLSERIEERYNDPKCSFEPIIFFVDEVHRYALEKNADGNYSSGLINIAREGRKYGIFLFLTSQSPKDIPPIILNQIGTLLVHNLTGKDDLKVISNYFDESTLNSLANLSRGEAILTSVNLIKNIQLKINLPSLSQGNETPYIG